MEVGARAHEQPHTRMFFSLTINSNSNTNTNNSSNKKIHLQEWRFVSISSSSRHDNNNRNNRKNNKNSSSSMNNKNNTNANTNKKTNMIINRFTEACSCRTAAIAAEGQAWTCVARVRRAHPEGAGEGVIGYGVGVIPFIFGCCVGSTVHSVFGFSGFLAEDVSNAKELIGLGVGTEDEFP